MTHAAEQLWTALFAGGDAVGEGRELVLFFLGAENPATGRRPKRSAWARSIPAALELLAAQQAAPMAAYFHVALHDRAAAVEAARELDERKNAARLREGKKARPPRPLAFVRGAARSARALGALWADFDVEGPDHTKEGLPKDRHEILDRLRGCPLQPSFLVYTSGGGVQAYWTLREPLELADDELARANAYGLVKGWELFLRDGLGLLPDPTADLARILRVPGVLDQRRGVEVTLPTATGKAYNPGEFREFALDVGPLFEKQRVGRVVDAGGLRLDPNAEPNWKKISGLLPLDRRFSDTWRRERKELKSQSEYDLSLAAQLLPLGFTEQEVVDALIYHRREAGEKEKLRPDYYAGTLGKVRSEGRAEDAYRRLDEAASADAPVAPPDQPAVSQAAQEVLGRAPPPAAAAPADPRETTLAALRDALGVDLRSIIKHPVDSGSVYAVVLGAQRHTLGGIEALLEAAVFRRRLADIAEVAVRVYKPAQWAPIAKMMLRVLEHETLGTESDAPGHIADLVTTYLDMKLRPGAGAGEYLVAGERQPFVDRKAGQVALFSLELGGWLKLRMGVDVTGKRLAQLLRWMGASPKQYRARRAEDGRARSGPEQWTTTSAWLIPTTIYPPVAADGEEAERAP